MVETDRPLRKFLVCYDYGMGGVWAPVIATSPEQILADYPELTVFAAKPPSMKQDFWDTELAKPAVYMDRPSDTILDWILLDRSR